MRYLLLPLLTISALGATPSAFSQNDCSSPLDVGSSLGTHSWSYSLFAPATDSGFDGAGTCQGEFLSLYNDAFFLWTAPSTGHFRFDTEFMGDDPELAIYRGFDCNAFCVAYDSDSGVRYTSDLVLQNVTAGEVFLVQVGTWQDVSFLDLTVGFTVESAPLPCLQPDDPFDENDTCAEALSLGPGYYYGLRVAKDDPDMYRICLPPGDTLDVALTFFDTEGDVDLFLFDGNGSGCGEGVFGPYLALGYTVTDNESLSYTNATSAWMDLVIHVELWEGNAYNECTDYNLSIVGGAACAQNPSAFCEPMSVNSTGIPTRLRGSFGSGVGSGLHLQATQGPPNQFAYFLVGTGASALGTSPVSQGYLCLDLAAPHQVGRFNLSSGPANSFGIFDAQGHLVNVGGTSTVGTGFDVPASLPLPGNPSIQAGQTWHFQLWHREDGGESNFSNGLSATF